MIRVDTESRNGISDWETSRISKETQKLVRKALGMSGAVELTSADSRGSIKLTIIRGDKLPPEAGRWLGSSYYMRRVHDIRVEGQPNRQTIDEVGLSFDSSVVFNSSSEDIPDRVLIDMQIDMLEARQKNNISVIEPPRSFFGQVEANPAVPTIIYQAPQCSQIPALV